MFQVDVRLEAIVYKLLLLRHRLRRPALNRGALATAQDAMWCGLYAKPRLQLLYIYI